MRYANRLRAEQLQSGFLGHHIMHVKHVSLISSIRHISTHFQC